MHACRDVACDVPSVLASHLTGTVKLTKLIVGTHGLRRVKRTPLVEGNRELKLDGQFLSVAVLEQSNHS